MRAIRKWQGEGHKEQRMAVRQVKLGAKQGKAKRARVSMQTKSTSEAARPSRERSAQASR